MNISFTGINAQKLWPTVKDNGNLKKLAVRTLPEGKLVGKAVVIDKVSGAPIVANIRKTTIRFNDRYSLFINRRKAGYVDFSVNEGAYFPDNKTKVYNYSYINMLESFDNNLKHIGQILMGLVYKDSPQGKIRLEAVQLNKKRGTPLFFYAKCGFKTLKKPSFIFSKIEPEKLDNKLQQLIKDNKNNSIFLRLINFKNIGIEMYLPSESVEKWHKEIKEMPIYSLQDYFKKSKALQK